MNWELKCFDELTIDELYQILKLRSLVFVVEQDCVYLDIDGRDDQAYHLIAKKEGIVVCYARLFKEDSTQKASIGRVVVHPDYRKLSLGKVLMGKAIEELTKLEQKEVFIHAQSYLENFYKSFDFKRVGDNFMEDEIPHVPMLLTMD